MLGSLPWMKLLHVAAALWLAASAFGGAVVRAVAKRTPDLAGKVAAMRIGARIGMIFGLPGSLVAGLTGIYLALPWLRDAESQRGWVHASITLWLLLFAANTLYGIPRAKRMLAAAEASLAAGVPSEELKRLASAKAPGMIADLNALGVIIFLVLMVLKPF